MTDNVVISSQTISGVENQYLHLGAQKQRRGRGSLAAALTSEPDLPLQMLTVFRLAAMAMADWSWSSGGWMMYQAGLTHPERVSPLFRRCFGSWSAEYYKECSWKKHGLVIPAPMASVLQWRFLQLLVAVCLLAQLRDEPVGQSSSCGGVFLPQSLTKTDVE